MHAVRLSPPGIVSGILMGLVAGAIWHPVAAQLTFITLAAGFTPNPMVLEGNGGGNRPAKDVVNTQQTPTGPCLGYISTTPHEEVSFRDRFSNLEMRVESTLDTTLIVKGPGGVWCNDDSQGKNPAITGDWLPGDYQVWIGAYRSGEVPPYELVIRDRR